MHNFMAIKSQQKVVFDQCDTTTYAWNLATAFIASLKNPVEGICHYGNDGVCSWFEFTKMIAEYSDQTECDILLCYSNQFHSSVTRPSYSLLDKTKIKDTLCITIPYWTESMKKCIDNLKK